MADYAVKVEGDSMVQTGLRDGDYVHLQTGIPAKDGDRVLVRYEDGELGVVHLDPTDPQFQETTLRKIIEALGVITGYERAIEETMFCPRCDRVNPANAIFCGMCAKKLKRGARAKKL